MACTVARRPTKGRATAAAAFKVDTFEEYARPLRRG